MTVVVAFLCSDGVVVAADSMITPTMGGLGIGHHKGKKIDIIAGAQIFAFAGDQGQAARLKAIANAAHGQLAAIPLPLNYALGITQAIVQQFTVTGINQSTNVNAVLAFLHGGSYHCSVYEAAIQPRMLDSSHYYVALGSGKLSADPFLRFLDDIFCKGNQPTVREALFLATWTVQHVIDVNPGGVAGPIRVAVIEKDAAGAWNTRDIPDVEMEEPQQAIDSAADALRDWWKNIQSGKAAEGTPPQPTPPAP